MALCTPLTPLPAQLPSMLTMCSVFVLFVKSIIQNGAKSEKSQLFSYFNPGKSGDIVLADLTLPNATATRILILSAVCHASCSYTWGCAKEGKLGHGATLGSYFEFVKSELTKLVVFGGTNVDQSVSKRAVLFRSACFRPVRPPGSLNRAFVL